MSRGLYTVHSVASLLYTFGHVCMGQACEATSGLLRKRTLYGSTVQRFQEHVCMQELARSYEQTKESLQSSEASLTTQAEVSSNQTAMPSGLAFGKAES